MLSEKLALSPEIQKQQFLDILNHHKEDLRKGIQGTQGFDAVAELVTPSHAEGVGFTFHTPMPDLKNAVYLLTALLFSRPRLNLVGITQSKIGYDSRRKLLVTNGLIATAVGGKYYGYGLELIRQQQLQAFTNAVGIPNLHTVHDENKDYARRESDQVVSTLNAAVADVKPHLLAQRLIWESLYSETNIFGYSQGIKMYFPTDEILSEEYSLRIQKKENQTSWEMKPKQDVKRMWVQGGFQNSEFFIKKLDNPFPAGAVL